MTQDLVAKSEKRNYGELFRFDLNWGAPDHPPVSLRLEDDTTLTATNVSSYKGLRVWEVPAFPGTSVEAQLDQLIAKTTTNRLVIFHEDDKQAWRWPSRTNRGAGVVSRPARHVHRTGSNDPKFAAKLAAIRLPDDVLLDVNAVLAKVRGAFDVEQERDQAGLEAHGPDVRRRGEGVPRRLRPTEAGPRDLRQLGAGPVPALR